MELSELYIGSELWIVFLFQGQILFLLLDRLFPMVLVVLGGIALSLVLSSFRFFMTSLLKGFFFQELVSVDSISMLFFLVFMYSCFFCL